MSFDLFNVVCHHCSSITTKKYSSSFSSAIRLLHGDLREDIYNIYGLVRFADEIVDTFHQFDKAALLSQFKADTYQAIDKRISLNPILQSFQLTVNKYQIDISLIEAFFTSMEWDLHKKSYDESDYQTYIYGSAEVVGLMCLYVFCEGNKKLYESLTPAARSLGAAFQKVNFLRDMNADYQLLSRVYFPGIDFNNFSEEMKVTIQKDIAYNFEEAYKGILSLPWKARFGVYVAYKYYWSLFNKIKKAKPSCILRQRFSVPYYQKLMIVARASIKNQLNII